VQVVYKNAAAVAFHSVIQI